MIIALTIAVLGIIALLELSGCQTNRFLGIALVMLVSRLTGIDVVEVLVRLIKTFDKW